MAKNLQGANHNEDKGISSCVNVVNLKDVIADQYVKVYLSTFNAAPTLRPYLLPLEWLLKLVFRVLSAAWNTISDTIRFRWDHRIGSCWSNNHCSTLIQILWPLVTSSHSNLPFNCLGDSKIHGIFTFLLCMPTISSGLKICIFFKHLKTFVSFKLRTLPITLVFNIALFMSKRSDEILI